MQDLNSSSQPRSSSCYPAGMNAGVLLPSPPEVMQVRDLLHTQPAELAAAHRARHVVTAPVVHLDDVGAATRARLDVISYGEEAWD